MTLPNIGPTLKARGWRLVRWSNRRATYLHERSGAVVETRGLLSDGSLQARINTSAFRVVRSFDELFDRAVAETRARNANTAKNVSRETKRRATARRR